MKQYATQDNFVSLEEELGHVQLNCLPCLCHVDVTCIILSLELGIIGGFIALFLHATESLKFAFGLHCSFVVDLTPCPVSCSGSSMSRTL